MNTLDMNLFNYMDILFSILQPIVSFEFDLKHMRNEQQVSYHLVMNKYIERVTVFLINLLAHVQLTSE